MIMETKSLIPKILCPPISNKSRHPKPVYIDEISFFAKSNQPVVLTFEDVTYKIKTKTKAEEKLGKERCTDRIVLNCVTGVVRPGEMLAVMGPSGCGKTTLLTALVGRLDGNLSGSITYNGKKFASSMSRKIGFVTQDDVLHPHLTVAETLVYTALLRLPNTLSKLEKVAHAEAVMRELSLTVCRDCIIGGGISGGERKRVSVGQEMLINPSLLFLDEPTSGLDSTNAQKLVATLSHLSRGGRTVLMTIHQPSSVIFHKFDKVLLLSDGNSVYFGKRNEAMDYFSSIGFTPLVPVNPADFLLDLANGVPPTYATRDKDKTVVKETLFAMYNQRLIHRVKQEIEQGNSTQYEELGGWDGKGTSHWTTNWWQQFRVLVERGFKERRHESFSVTTIAQIFAITVIICVYWWKSQERIQDQVGFLYYMVSFWGYIPLVKAVQTFPQERTMLTKERSSRMYRLSTYVCSAMVVDLPMELLLPTIFMLITYWTVGLRNSATAFFLTLGILLLQVLVAQGIGLAIGALVMDIKAATTLAAIIQLLCMLLGGFFARKMPAFISWMKHISYNYHGFKLVVSAQYTATTTYPCAGAGICRVGDIPSVKLIGFAHLWWSVVIMFAILIACRLGAFLALMRIGVAK